MYADYASNFCSKTYFNPHLKKNHAVKRNFSQYVFTTTGYMIPKVKTTFSYLYREQRDTKPPTSMTTIEGAHTHFRHEDKFLRIINANLYYGKGYPRGLYASTMMLFDLQKSTISVLINHGFNSI